MSSKKTILKNLVQEIQKLAKPVPLPPAGYSASNAPAPTPSVSPNTTNVAPKAYTGRSIVSVQTMQQDLINLAKDVSSQINIQNIAQPPSPTGAPTREATEASGRGAFSNFITKNYLRSSDVPGVEFNPDPTKTQMADKHPSDPTRMSTVMDTMQRIGNPKTGEFAVDGKWGPRTNAAIHNAYALAFGMLNLAKDFKLQPTTYSAENLAALKSKIPENDTDIDSTQKEELAVGMSKHIKAIHRLYDEVKNGILERPANRAYIEGDQVFHTYKKEGPNADAMASMVKAFGDSHDNTKLRVTITQGGQKREQAIAVSDLVSPQAFEQWRKTYAPESQAGEVLTSLKTYVDRQFPSQGQLPVQPVTPVPVKVH